MCRKIFDSMKANNASIPPTKTENENESTSQSYFEELTMHLNHKTNTKIKLSTLEPSSATVPIILDGKMGTAVADSGADRLFIRPELAKFIRPCKDIIVELADGKEIVINAEAIVKYKIGGREAEAAFLILDGLTTDCIIGLDTQAQIDLMVQARHKCILIGEKRVEFLPRKTARKCCLIARKKMSKTTAGREALRHNPDNLITIIDSKTLRCQAIILTEQGDDPVTHKCQFDLTIEAEQLQAAKDLVESNVNCFATKDNPLGSANGVYHCVQPSGKSYKQKMRPLSPAMMEEQRKQIQKMLLHGVIRRSTSEWAATPSFSPKKDGTWRFNINFRRINKMCEPDRYPLPRAPDLLEIFQGMNWFTKLDAAMGYWQMSIHPDDVKYCSFVCQEGQFELIRMSFGLMNAPATFQRFNDNVLKPILRKFAVVYIDDIFIYSKTFEEHLKHVDIAMKLIQKSGQLLRADKCDFFMKEVEFLGHIVGRGGIRMCQDKLNNILIYPKPQTKEQVRRFIGITSYYRKFVKDFAKFASPINELTKQNTPFLWDDQCDKAFDELLKRFNENAVLAHPNYDKEFIIDCDARDHGVGAVLLQQNENGEQPAFFASRKLTAGEKKWPPRDKEALAIVWALSVLRHHVLGRHFTVRADHESLEWLVEAKTGRIARWALMLAEYEPFTIKYRSGKLNKPADALSRLHEPSEILPDVAHCAAITSTSLTPRCDDGAIDENERMSNQMILWSRTLKAAAPDSNELYRAQREDDFCLKRLANLKRYPRFCIKNRLLGIEIERQFRPVLPASLAEDVIRAFHASPEHAHMGPKRTAKKVADVFVVPKIRKLCESILRRCLTYLARKEPIQRTGWLASKPSTRMWEQVAMDFGGPYPESITGKRYMLVIIDHFSKYVEMIATEAMTASVVINAFYERIVCRHGCPERVLSDNHRQFKNSHLEAVCAMFGCYKSFTSAYYPQRDGQVERNMRNMNNSLSILCNNQVYNWCSYVPGVQFAYNTTVHSVTGVTPFFLNHGRNPRYPMQVEYGNESETRVSPIKFARNLRNIIDNVRRIAADNVRSSWQAMAKAYNRGRTKVKIAIGDYVMIRLTPTTTSMEQTYVND